MDLMRIIDQSVEASYETIKRNEDDYIGEDGLLYCGKCNTPKQVEVEILGEKKRPYCQCKCEQERIKVKELAEKRRCLIDARRVACFPDTRMFDWTFENDDGADVKMTGICKNYVENFEKARADGKGLMLFGTCGTGKTYMAACIGNALVDKCYTVRFTNFQKISAKLQGRLDNQEDVYNTLNRYDLLIIDDMSAERKTEFMQEIVYNTIDSRYRSGLPLIITTNLTREQINNPSDEQTGRIISRLLEMTIPIEMIGKDRRKTKLKNDYGEYAQLLGI